MGSVDEKVIKFRECLSREPPVDEIYEKVMRSGVFEEGYIEGFIEGFIEGYVDTLVQDFEPGMSQTFCENVINLSEFGMSTNEISQALNVDFDIINEILS